MNLITRGVNTWNLTLMMSFISVNVELLIASYSFNAASYFLSFYNIILWENSLIILTLATISASFVASWDSG